MYKNNKTILITLFIGNHTYSALNFDGNIVSVCIHYFPFIYYFKKEGKIQFVQFHKLVELTLMVKFIFLFLLVTN
jgi:hypothetical protein